MISVTEIGSSSGSESLSNTRIVTGVTSSVLDSSGTAFGGERVHLTVTVIIAVLLVNPSSSIIVYGIVSIYVVLGATLLHFSSDGVYVIV